MKQLLLKILKVILLVSVSLIALALIFGLVLYLGWPWWVGFFVVVGVVGLVIGCLFLKKILNRQREQKFVQQVIDQEAAYAAPLADKDKERSQDLQNRWKEAMDALRSSHLKKMGNPLYVLPWYLVIGESGSGKTTGIKSARLSSPFAEVSRTSGISGTRNCDWWFFEQAIILDTAGRYAIPVDEGRDKDEWQKFLTHLAKFRKREPLNGLVLTIAADKLLSASAEELEADGRSLRLRIDELMRVLGAKFPVYMLVTKCDLVQGMTQFCNRLPDQSLDQAMGIMNHDLSRDIATFHEHAMHTMSERLKDMRLQLLHQSAAGKADPELLLFPEEFERLKAGLAAFSKGTFQENPYQETPILRGLFFSSGRQEGSPYSHFLKSLGLIEDRDVLPGTNTGMFLFDFFAKILPGDRGLFAPTMRAIEWSRLTRNLGLTAWVAIIIAVCGLLSFSFVKNLRTLRAVSQEFSSPPVLHGEMVSDVVLMDRFRQTILDLEARNQSWWIPRFGLHESLTVEQRLKDVYSQQFEEILLAGFDKRMADRMTGFTDATACQDIGNHLAHLVRRINLLKSRWNGKELADLQASPQPEYAVFTPDTTNPLMPELQDRLRNLYLYDLIWRRDRSKINQEMNTQQTWLKHILALKGKDLTCLVDWANADPALSPVRLADFWHGSRDPADASTIMPAFTLKGKDKIEQFIKEMETALLDPLMVAGGKLEFQKWYQKNYLDAWHLFGDHLPDGRAGLVEKTDWDKVINRIANGQGPYFTFITRMTEEVAPFRDAPDRPWIGLAYEFEAAKAEAERRRSATRTGLLSKATEKGRSLLSRVDRTGSSQEAARMLEARMTATTAMDTYQQALATLSTTTTSRKIAFETAARTFEEAETGDTATAKTPFLASEQSIRTLAASFQSTRTDTEMFWDLVAGPQQLLWEYACNESACHIDKLWEDKILLEIEDMNNKREINNLLLGDNGLATDLIKADIAPFIGRSLKKGFFPRRVLGREIPFDADFFTYLTKGSKYITPAGSGGSSDVTGNVTIKGLPTDVNKGARIRPHATNLEVECDGKPIRLINLNYPVRRTFAWSPATCGDVIFSIEVGRLVLTKKYTGSLGFARFLSEFNQGKRRWYPKDFPEHREELERLKIKYILVNYQFTGHWPIVEYYRKSKAIPSVPRKIAQCWDQ